MQAVKYFLAMLLFTGLWACTKSKSDFVYQEQPLPPLSASTVRLINVGRKATELLINDTPLTSLTPPNIEGNYLSDQTKPTIYFPTGRIGTTFAIPQRFIRGDGTARITIGYMMYGTPGLVAPKNIDIKENVNEPADYYNVLYGPHPGSDILVNDSTFRVPRSISPPANPEHFRIRVLNLSNPGDRASLQGNMSLSFADGTLVSNTTSHVAPGNYSDYIELPYGTYQFKIKTDDGRIVPGVPLNSGEMLGNVNPLTGTMVTGDNQPKDIWLSYAASQTFQPGGVYTVLVSSNTAFKYLTPGNTSATDLTLNSFRVIADVKESLNITYGRVQAVNAIAGANISVTADGLPLQENVIGYTNASAYKTLVSGPHVITAKDASGNKIAEATLNINGSDNYSAWLFNDANGKPVMKLVNNNLSGSFYLPTAGSNKGDDGANSQYKVTMPYWVRFLNLSTDVPEITFTEANGQLLTGYLTFIATGSQHLSQGQVVTDQPYVQFSPLIGINRLNVYASKPGVLPGDWITTIPALKGSDFIARPDLYAGGQLPLFETGIYTVALTGTLHPKQATDVPAKMIIVKHNQ
ncbi:DUF4397 domain-containing protein [Chitinophaga vietnamensis]|nr:DUF4397 domain-containing protein [Chitinophaga vietnamensis]